MIRKTLLAGVFAIVAFPALAQQFYNGYTRQDGTYVQPHYQTAPNNTRQDNWSTQGNVNPYTGQFGTQPAYPQQQQYPSGSVYGNPGGRSSGSMYR